MARRAVLLHNPGSDPAQVKCIVKECKNLSDDLASLLSSAKMWAFGNWCENVRKQPVQPSFSAVHSSSSKFLNVPCRSYVSPPGCTLPAPNPLTVLHAMAGGRCRYSDHLCGHAFLVC
jgi:hypothetical protein